MTTLEKIIRIRKGIRGVIDMSLRGPAFAMIAELLERIDENLAEVESDLRE